MKKTEFSQLHELLPKIVNQFNLGRQVTGSVACHNFRKIIQSVWHEEVTGSVLPISFVEGLLIVSVSDSGWAQQVQFKRSEIMKKMKEANFVIKNMIIRVDPQRFAESD
jgi:hypothetical protein